MLKPILPLLALGAASLAFVLSGCKQHVDTAGGIAASQKRDDDPNAERDDPSIVYTERGRGHREPARHFDAFDETALWVAGIQSCSVPEWGTRVERHDKADLLLVYAAKHFHDDSIGPESWDAKSIRKHMGCVTKVEDGKLWLGTYGEFVPMLEIDNRVTLRIVAPRDLTVVQVKGLHGGHGGLSNDSKGPRIAPAEDADLAFLTQKKVGIENCWLPPAEQGKWFKVPTVADPQRRARAGKGEPEKGQGRF
jgi:hypothetical protein